MERGTVRLLGGLAAAAFAAAALSYLPAARLLRYATLAAFERPDALLLAAGACAGAALHETLVRGLLYGALRRRLPPGAGAALTVLLGIALPLAARLLVFPVPGVPRWLVVSHASLVELLLSLGLTWLALGSGSPLPGAAALFLVWAGRALVTPTYHGGIVPALELLAAGAAAAAVAAVLARPLAPHREALEGPP